MKFVKAAVLTTIALVSFSILVPIGIYILNFSGKPISDNPERSAQFADYMNPAISLATLFVTDLIAYILNRIEEDRKKKEENTQIILMISQFRQESIRTITEAFIEIEKATVKENITVDKINELLRFLHYHDKAHRHFFEFPLYKKEFDDLNKALNDLRIFWKRKKISQMICISL